jgi:hypothetical protein
MTRKEDFKKLEAKRKNKKMRRMGRRGSEKEVKRRTE